MGRVVLENELAAERVNWKRSGSRVVLVYGAFDLLHPGHIRLLEQARALGDVLVVAVENDASLRAVDAADISRRSERNEQGQVLSGFVTPAAERAEILVALAAVDFAVEIDSASFADFVASLQPEVLVKGGAGGGNDLPSEDSRAEASVKRAGGKIVAIPLEPGYSTAGLMGRIRQLRA